MKQQLKKNPTYEDYLNINMFSKFVNCSIRRGSMEFEYQTLKSQLKIRYGENVINEFRKAQAKFCNSHSFTL
jgi:hypothetical protein